MTAITYSEALPAVQGSINALFNPDQPIEPDTALNALGVDDLSGLELAAYLEDRFGVEVNVAPVGASTVKDLAEELVKATANA
ncbi:acyl carrier protein [Streptomyces sp. NPDC085466]|uniref:acyl carrier protein n=1 Tax=Streptomyces sp. NPDC085466 TaxID=3365725 RepID=UPI0037D54AE5